MKRYTIEAWIPLDLEWKRVEGCPTLYESRSKAEQRLHFEATVPRRRCRLVNGKGKPVLFAGTC